MLALLSILSALTLLGLTVFALHKYQTMEVEFNVDRSLPLPPLQGDNGADKTNQKVPLTKPVQEFDNKRAVASKSSKEKVASTTSKTWQESVTRLKNDGKYAEAAALCERQLPLWGAYNQLCMLLRYEIKGAKIDSALREEKLKRLFATAAIAEFLHDKSSGNTKPALQKLQELDLQKLATLDFPYAEIGYAHLRLIRKSDIKHMVELWGRPDSHLAPREFHRDWWQRNMNG